jgi:hypothetical protein
VSFAAITLRIASLRVFIVVYFVIDSVRKLLDTPSYDDDDDDDDNDVSILGENVNTINKHSEALL